MCGLLRWGGGSGCVRELGLRFAFEEFRVPRGAGAAVTYPKTQVSPEVSGRRSDHSRVLSEDGAASSYKHPTTEPLDLRFKENEQQSRQ